MFCGKCGKELIDGTAFCGYCGGETGAGNHPIENGMSDGNIRRDFGSGKGNYQTGIIVALATLLAICIGIVCYLLVNRYNLPEKVEMSSNSAGENDEGLTAGEIAEEPSNVPLEMPTEVPTEVPEVAVEESAPEVLTGEAQEEYASNTEADEKFESLKAEIQAMNSGSEAIDMFDPSEDNYSPKERNDGKCWDKTLFYALEEKVQSNQYYYKDTCRIKKVQLRNALTGDVVDYDVYLNPDNNLPNKIVGIEYVDEGIDVYEYYFDNAGKVNFIFKYSTDNYVSTYATISKAGERFLFDDDTLTTWRFVDSDGNVDNYCSTDAERERLKKSSYKDSSIIKYQDLSSEKKKMFGNIERTMINYAYNTYNAVLNADGMGQIIGCVYTCSYQPTEDVVVELFDENFKRPICSTRTDSRGEYQFYVPYDKYNYNLRVKAEKDSDKAACDIYDVEMNANSIVNYVDSVIYFSRPDDYDAQEIKIYIGNAFYGHGSSVGDAAIKVRNGINNRCGDVILNTRTDSDGYVVLELLPGMYTIEATKAGYESIFYTIVSNPREENVYEYYTPPNLDDDEVAIVLSWGVRPADLDSHLFTNASESQHVWYRNKSDKYSSFLDVDDTDSYGPETVTIRKFDPDKYYKYCVIDYTNSSSGFFDTLDMSCSNATVNVYSAKGHMATFHVPVNKSGVAWEVFEFRNGMLVPIQRYYDSVNNTSWWSH